MDRRRVLLVAAAVVAALGTVLVFLYVRGADNRAQDKYQTTQVLVATQQIATGESIASAVAAGKIDVKQVPQDDVLPNAAVNTDGIATLLALTNIYPGEQIIPAKLGTDASMSSALPIPAGKLAISINLSDPARVAGFIRPGAQVAIIYSGASPRGANFVKTLLPKVTVLGVGSSTPAPVDPTAAQAPVEAVANSLLTLALSQEDAQRILFAQNGGGQLTFALLTADAKVEPGLVVDENNLFGKR